MKKEESTSYAKHLWVEGKSEQQIIPYLMEENGIPWPDNPYPVYIHDKGGFTNISNKDDLCSFFKSHLRMSHFGIIVDADELAPCDSQRRPQRRWESLQNTITKFLPDIRPIELQKDGVIFQVSQSATIPNDVKFGVWVMPDNQNPGMLETFLARLIPDESPELWHHAQSSVTRARELNAPFKEVDLNKINLRTWLTWQNKPDSQILSAINVHPPLLQLTHQNAQTFVTWFKTLYDL
jgi:hypothetical protein